MTFKIAPHLAAAAFALGLSPVNAQTSGALTNLSAESVILAQAPNSARTGPMASNNFNHTGGKKVEGMEVSGSHPLVDEKQSVALLSRIEPSLWEVLKPLAAQVLLPFRHAGKIGPFLITGQLPPANVGGVTAERDFIHFFHDINGAGTGRSFNIPRVEVSSEEQFNKLQSSGMLSRNAMWTNKPGKFMLGNDSPTSPAFKADRNRNQHFYNPVDPYAYLGYLTDEKSFGAPGRAKFKTKDGALGGEIVRDKKGVAIIENIDDPQFQRILADFDPRWVGLPLDPSVEVNAPLARPHGNFSITQGGGAPGQPSRPGQPAGNRTLPGTNIQF